MQRELKAASTQLQVWLQSLEDVLRQQKQPWVRVDGGQYQAAQQALLVELRNCDGTSSDEHQIAIRQLIQLVEPWSRLESLRNADQRVIRSLIVRTTEIQAVLRGRKASAESARIMGVMLFCLLVATVTFWMFSSNDLLPSRPASSVMESWRGQVMQFAHAARQSTFFERTTVGTVLLVIACTQILRRTRVD